MRADQTPAGQSFKYLRRRIAEVDVRHYPREFNANEFPVLEDGLRRRFVVDANERGIGTVKYPRIVPKDAAAEKELKKRTLTNLYNARPAWLTNAHATLDAAVLAAYGWPADITDADLLAKLLELNLSRASATTEGDVETSKAD